MKFYLISSTADTSESIPYSYKEIAQSEPCVYKRMIPDKYIDNPTADWPQDTSEKLKRALNIKKSEYRGEPWTEFEYEGLRYFIRPEDINLKQIVKLAGGQVNIYGRHMENSTRFFEDDECSVFLGLPDIGDNMVLEFVDDNLEAELLQFSRNV